MVTPEDARILQFGQQPNVIIGPDRVTTLDSVDLQDCGGCGAYRRSHWVALAPSCERSGYRVAGLCSGCAQMYVDDGRAVDRRPSDPEYQRFQRAMGQEN